jgi:hypothetical protein
MVCHQIGGHPQLRTELTRRGVTEHERIDDRQPSGIAQRRMNPRPHFN